MERWVLIKRSNENSFGEPEEFSFGEKKKKSHERYYIVHTMSLGFR